MRTVAIVNQKGGCGKTTTTVNLAGCLADDGARVLVVDVDPQAHATLALGIDPDQVEENVYEVLSLEDGAGRLAQIVRPAGENIDVVPSGIVLSALEQKLAAERSDERTKRLARALEGVAERYDYALIDCPPNVGLLTFNALRACQEVIVPLETSYFAIHGVRKVLETIELLSERVGHQVRVHVLPTLYDGRTRYARETLAEIRESFGDRCFDVVIRTNVKLREAARRGKPINRIARSANGTVDYQALAAELAAAMPTPEAIPVQRDAAMPAPEAIPVERDAALSVPEALPVEPGVDGSAPREVVVQFRAEDVTDVRIAGDFNGWIPDKGVRSMIQSEDGSRVWTKILQLPPGTYEYRYVVDGEWQADPENPNTAEGPVGNKNSVLIVY
ncbi:MAG: AAA family ATPase [Myxococcota bacterium]